jgi:hypothetical protein
MLRWVARERRISLQDPELRHGVKSHRQRIDGYRRQVLRVLDSELVHAVGARQRTLPRPR